MKKELMLKEKGDYEYLHSLRTAIEKHSMYDICKERLDAGLDISGYESGTILGISTTREDFDELYEYNYCYRGGLMEIKVGEHYVIYGFDFD